MALDRDPDKLREWQRRSARRWRSKRRRSKEDASKWSTRVRERAYSVGMNCEADGMHDPTCPGIVGLGEGQGHHVHPRSWGGDDRTSPVMWVWPSCHARIHNRPREATERGYLTRGRD